MLTKNNLVLLWSRSILLLMFIIDYYSRARLRHQFTLLIQPLRNIILFIFNLGWYLLFLFQSFPFL